MGALMRNGIGYSNNGTGVLMRNGINYTGTYSGGGGGDYQSLDFDLVADTYINSSGVEQPYNGWSSSDYISVDGLTEIYVCGISGGYNAWYDSSQIFISVANISSGKALAVPTNAKYLRISDTTANMSTTKIFAEV